MRKFRVTLYSGKAINLGGFGSAAMGYCHGVEVPDDQGEKEAIEKARAEVAAMPDWSEYAKGRASAEEVFTWAITLRGRDKRRRETFYTRGTSEFEALTSLSNIRAAYVFSGYYGPKVRKRVIQPDERVIKVART